MNKFIFLLLKLVILPSTVMQGVISFSLHEDEKGTILNLGDCHDEVLNEVNEENYTKLCSILEKADPKKPIKIYLEGDHSKLKQDERAKMAHSILVIQNLLQKIKAKKQGIDFELYEPRSDRSDYINGHLVELDQQFYKNKNCIKKEGLLPFLKFKCLAQRFEKNDPLTITSYLKGLEEDERKIKNWRDEFVQNSPEYNLFDKKLSLFAQSKKSLEQGLLNQDPNKSLMLGFLAFIEKEGVGLSKLFNRFHLLHDLAADKSDYVVANAGFLKKFLDEKNQKTYNVVFLTGEAHRKALSEDFNTLDIKTITSDTVMQKINKNQTIYRFRPEFIKATCYALAYCITTDKTQISMKKELLSLCPQKQKNENSVSPICENNKNISAVSCGYCKKTAQLSQNLLRCSKCKNVRYCNQECQRKDWNEHKKNCK